ncbi:hypothetical protein RJ641_025187 [Dillenia turbinata]|uniref:GIR1-like zinc ribbon domain-containing protein n=1 Tax=Dillenia turbinata TaxID=194707 RepID=A0AAN8ZSN5_9MAGN
MSLEVQSQQDHVDGGGACGGALALVPSLTSLRQHTPLITDLESINLTTPNRDLEGTEMSRRTEKNPRLDLKLNLSQPRVDPRVISPSRAATVSPTSPPSSCASSELSQEEALTYSDSPEVTSMLLVGCPRCLMYVMLSERDPKCPKCKSTVLVDFLQENANKKTGKS